MSLRLGDTAPNFKAVTTLGEIDFYNYLGDKWGVLLSHPGDFTPVCTTEIGRTAQLSEEFKKRNTKVLVVSVDSLEDHNGWVKDINEVANTVVDFPLIADKSRAVSELYDMIHPNASATATVRSVFIIGPDKKIKLVLTYPAAIGRNFQEIIRALDALQLSSEFGISTPVDWKKGEEVIVANSLSDTEAKKKFPKGVRVVKSYLRYTPQPDFE
ncbi:MAG: peroxiredoxin [Flavisolibacter sp.]|nr:peroxiredoxin [Flavisolibacter sp.]